MQPYNAHFLGNVFFNPAPGSHDIPELTSCPLCGCRQYMVIGRFEINDLIQTWLDKHHFNPIDDAFRNHVLEKRKCAHCDLSYYNYHLADSPEMYAKLAMDDYYPSFRPEYGVASEIIQSTKPHSLLEIGCGNGAFLNRIAHLVPLCMGSEYNAEAAETCRTQGLNVITTDIFQIDEMFDIVCHFEVLEHVFDTMTFMSQTLSLVRPGGKLIIGTPNPDGLLAINGKGILNLPPHHQFEFSHQTFKYLAKIFDLKIIDYVPLPIEYRHYAKYVKQISGMDLSQPDMVGFYKTQEKFAGHSHVVIFEK